MSQSKRGCEAQTTTITQSDLPLCCPAHDERVWDAHPRVYLPIEESPDQTISCPYCGTRYCLEAM